MPSATTPNRLVHASPSMDLARFEKIGRNSASSGKPNGEHGLSDSPEGQSILLWVMVVAICVVGSVGVGLIVNGLI